jgi:hypothetical protein
VELLAVMLMEATMFGPSWDYGSTMLETLVIHADYGAQHFPTP